MVCEKCGSVLVNLTLFVAKDTYCEECLSLLVYKNLELVAFEKQLIKQQKEKIMGTIYD